MDLLKLARSHLAQEEALQIKSVMNLDRKQAQEEQRKIHNAEDRKQKYFSLMKWDLIKQRKIDLIEYH
jgi:hypothetical protein